jgi:hypothetical protein
MVIDLGASFGRTKILPGSGPRNDIDDLAKQGFVKGVGGGRVKFDGLGPGRRALDL